jgi:ADP-ribosylglycohydrolase
MTHEEIMRITDGKGVTTFVDLSQARIKDARNIPIGGTTDDTAATRAVARSLINCKGYDHVDCAQEMIHAMNLSPFGWGKTTKNSLRAIEQYLSKHPDVGVKSYELPKPEGDGCGNGVAMRIAPLALTFSSFACETDRWNTVFQHGMMTHPDPRASSAAYAVACVIDALIGTHDNSVDELVLLAGTLIACARMEKKCGIFDAYSETMTSQLRTIIIRHLTSEDVLRNEIGTGCFSLQSVPFAIGVATKPWNISDFRRGVLEAVNAGGDTDTTASIVGAIIGAHVGMEGIPEEWRTFRDEYREPIYLAKELYAVMQEEQYIPPDPAEMY